MIKFIAPKPYFCSDTTLDLKILIVKKLAKFVTTLCETKGSREYKIRCNTYKSRISYQLRLTFNVNLLKLTPTIATLGIGITNYQLPMPTAYRTSTYFLATIGPENNYLVDLKNLKINQTCAGSVVSSVVFNSNNEISNPFNWTWWKINGKEAVVEKFKVLYFTITKMSCCKIGNVLLFEWDWKYNVLLN